MNPEVNAQFLKKTGIRLKEGYGETECSLAIVTYVPDEIRGQIVKATVVLTREYAPSEDLVEEMQVHVRKLTAPYKYPRILEFLPELPKTISGKIRRIEIREKDQESKGAET